jgi:hypothetical protein
MVDKFVAATGHAFDWNGGEMGSPGIYVPGLAFTRGCPTGCPSERDRVIGPKNPQ